MFWTLHIAITCPADEIHPPVLSIQPSFCIIGGLTERDHWKKSGIVAVAPIWKEIVAKRKSI